MCGKLEHQVKEKKEAAIEKVEIKPKKC